MDGPLSGQCIGGDLALSLGNLKHFSWTKFSNDLFYEKFPFPILTPKISDDLFYSHRPSFVCLLPVSILSQISYIYIQLYTMHAPFLNKNLYFRTKIPFTRIP